MGDVSNNILFQGLVQLLDKTFKRRVYGSEIAQGFEEPCFFISILEQSEEPLIGRRSRRTYRFDVQYFPAKGREDAFDVADKLYDLLALIPVNGDLYRGSGMNMRCIDDVLHFFVEYNFHLLRPVDEPKMEHLEFNGGVKVHGQ